MIILNGLLMHFWPNRINNDNINWNFENYFVTIERILNVKLFIQHNVRHMVVVMDSFLSFLHFFLSPVLSGRWNSLPVAVVGNCLQEVSPLCLALLNFSAVRKQPLFIHCLACEGGGGGGGSAGTWRARGREVKSVFRNVPWQASGRRSPDDWEGILGKGKPGNPVPTPPALPLSLTSLLPTFFLPSSVSSFYPSHLCLEPSWLPSRNYTTRQEQKFLDVRLVEHRKQQKPLLPLLLARRSPTSPVSSTVSNLNSGNPPDSRFEKLSTVSHRLLLHRLRRVFCWRGERERDEGCFQKRQCGTNNSADRLQ